MRRMVLTVAYDLVQVAPVSSGPVFPLLLHVTEVYWLVDDLSLVEVAGDRRHRLAEIVVQGPPLLEHERVLEGLPGRRQIGL